jgi:hypothetical protein
MARYFVSQGKLLGWEAVQQMTITMHHQTLLLALMIALITRLHHKGNPITLLYYGTMWRPPTLKRAF